MWLNVLKNPIIQYFGRSCYRDHHYKSDRAYTIRGREVLLESGWLTGGVLV